MLTISKLGSQAGVTADTIRFYEREGLLPPPERSSSGYRIYGDEQLERLQFIRGAQRAGLRLRDIRELLEVRDRGLCPCGHTETLINQRVEEIDAEISHLTMLRKELTALSDRFGPATQQSAGRWPCEREFIHLGKEVS
jgi:DNA-binding transcriptional MerR regulator